jgi:hypothetical protein
MTAKGKKLPPEYAPGDDYRPVPVAAAAAISENYRKQIVVIFAWDAEHSRSNVSTFGISASDKIVAAEAGERMAEFLGLDMAQRRTHEDFRYLDCAQAKERIDELQSALARSVRLQSHYAWLLNGYDGGKRLQFANASEWLERLRMLKDQATTMEAPEETATQ